MDYSEDTNNKIPFYMTYPMQNLYLTEMEYEKDMERMKELYPKEVKKILLCIEDRCDELEFEGSRIFDENPDRLMMEREVQRLYQKIREDELEAPGTGAANRNGNMTENMPETEQGQNFGTDTDMMQNNAPVTESEPRLDTGMMRNGMPEGGEIQEERTQNRIPESQMRGMGIGKSPFALFPPEGFLLPEEQPQRKQGTDIPPQEKELQEEQLQLTAQSGKTCDGWLCSMIGVLFSDEVYRRRCRHRRCRRWW